MAYEKIREVLNKKQYTSFELDEVMAGQEMEVDLDE